jgi:demethylmenaquinone methyltransferase/2-methoxy-6-polyprenyl-1,4-benzoquinol methylase
MSNPFYIPGEQRAARVQDLFGGIARRYDLINDVQSFGLHRLWKRRLVTLAGIQPGEHALDVCCGTGDIAFALARRGAIVTGLDFSEPMLAVARTRRRQSETQRQAKTKDAGPSGVPQSPEFFQGDAQKLPFANDSFDAVTVGYGLRNLADWKTGLQEMRRVARPGGRLLVLDFGKPDFPLWRAIYFGYLRFLVPLVGRVFCGNAQAYSYILESLRHYPAQRGVADGMRALGMNRVRIVNLLGGVMSINYGEKSASGTDPDKIESHCQSEEPLARM